MAVERLLDAGVLLDEDGAALLVQSEAARHSLAQGDEAAARRSIEQLVLLTEAFLVDRVLDLADGKVLLETARRILTGQAG